MASTDLFGLLIAVIVVGNILWSIVQGVRRVLLEQAAREGGVQSPPTTPAPTAQTGTRPQAIPGPGVRPRRQGPMQTLPRTGGQTPTASSTPRWPGAATTTVAESPWLTLADFTAETRSRITLPSAADVFGLPPVASVFPVSAGDAAAGRPVGGSTGFVSLPGGYVSPAGLFVAAAIIGPCAALRALGRTPGGW